jgi:hypothetical protein
VGVETDGASVAATAPPTASCKNSRRCLPAIRIRHSFAGTKPRFKGPDLTSLPANMKISPQGRQRVATKRVPSKCPAVVYRFLQRSETLFVTSVKSR